MRLTKAICCSLFFFEDDAVEKPFFFDAKKTLAEATQLLESVLETEALKTFFFLRKKVHQIKVRLFFFCKENWKDDKELRNIAARLNRMDETLQLQ